MATLGELGRRMWMLAHRRQVDRDLDEELRTHEEHLRARAELEGAWGSAADRAARGRLGSPLRIREDTHEALGWRWLEDLAQDVRYGLRGLVARKGYALTVVAMLALGCGGTAAIFSIISAVVLRPLPFAEPARLVQILEITALSPEGGPIGWADMQELKRQARSVEALAGYEVSARYSQIGQERMRVMAVGVDRELFDLLGARARDGRTFRADDPPTVVVVAAAFWREHFGDRPVGPESTITLDGETHTVVGVMADAFQFPYRAASLLPGVVSAGRTDLWRPIGPAGQPRQGRSSVVARLSRDAGIGEAQSELAVVSARLEAANPRPQNPRRGLRVVSLSDTIVTPVVRQRLFLIFGAVGLVLLLACANVANLSLVRMASRARELAARSALGAGGSRLVRQLLTESVLVAIAGGIAGIVVAWWAAAAIASRAAAYLPRAHEVGLHWTVFGFLLAVCVIAGLLAGIAPAMATARRGTHALVHLSGTRSTMTRAEGHIRDGLVILEVAMTCALAVGAAGILQELMRLRNTDSGLVTARVLTFHLGERMAPGADGRVFYDIVDRVSTVPGVERAAFTQLLPLQNWGWTSNSTDFRVRGGPDPAVFPINLRYVTPDYFQTLGIPLLRGRAFDRRDDRNGVPVIAINNTLARRYFGEVDPTGTVTTRGQIVAVVGDVRQVALDKPAEPEIYFPIAQNWSQVSDLGMSLVVRTAGDPEGLVEPIRAAIRDVNPNYVIFNVKTMDAVVSDSLAELSLFLALMATFTALALALALSGTYGVVRFIAASRAREHAVRMALGARRRDITRLVLRQGVKLVGAGLLVGLAIVAGVSPILRSWSPGAAGAGSPSVACRSHGIAARRVALATPLPSLHHASNPLGSPRSEA